MFVMKSFNNILYFKQVCKDCHQALLFCDDLYNKELILTAISSNYMAFEYVPKCFKADFNFALECAKIAPEIITYIDSRLISNPEWVAKAIRVNHKCFFYLSKLNSDVAKDKNLCVLACDLINNVDMIDKSLFDDYGFLYRIISQNCFAITKVIALCNLSKVQKEELCLKAISINEQVFCLLPKEVINDIHFIQRALFANINVKKFL